MWGVSFRHNWGGRVLAQGQQGLGGRVVYSTVMITRVILQYRVSHVSECFGRAIMRWANLLNVERQRVRCYFPLKLPPLPL